MTLPRIAVAVSGGGRTLANLLTTGHQKDYEVAAVIASRSDCAAIAVAKQYGVAQYVGRFAPDSHPTPAQELFSWLQERDVKWIALAGFIKRFPLDSAWQQRIINIHPALLPEFGGPGMYGMNVHKAVIASPAQWTGASIHFVTADYDEGAVISQAVVARRLDDTAESLAARVFRAECRLYPRVLAGLVTGRLPLKSGQVEKVTYDDL